MNDSQVPAADAEGEQALALLRDCTRLAQLFLAQTARSEGLLVTELNALTRIVDNDGITLGVLASSLPLDSSSMTELADRLERSDLVRRSRVPTDRRTVALHAKRRGKAKIARAYGDLYLGLAGLFAELSEDELNGVVRLLNGLRSLLEAQTAQAADPKPSHKGARATTREACPTTVVT